MRKPVQRAPKWEPESEPLPEPKPVPWHWKALAGLMATAILLVLWLALANATATDEQMAALAADLEKAKAEIVVLATPAPPVPAPPHYPSGTELDHYVVKVALSGGHGSGVVVGDGTYVLTAGHVAAAAGADGQVVIVRQDGTAVDGEVLWIALKDDIALIKIAEKLPAAPLACSAPTVGEAIEVVGHPAFGQTLDWAHTLGHVVQVYDNGYGVKEGRRVMFFDANVYFGNSGGPIFNSKGEVIGIVSALLGVNVGGAFSSAVVPFGYNIAVPADVACGMMPL